jgi:hypothetical protein
MASQDNQEDTLRLGNKLIAEFNDNVLTGQLNRDQKPSPIKDPLYLANHTLDVTLFLSFNLPIRKSLDHELYS